MNASETNDSKVILLEEVKKSYGSKPALRGISLEASAGEVLGYLGPNGAGKTTTVKILTAMLAPDSGSVRVCGFDARRDPIEVKRRVGYVPEEPALYDSMTPMEYGRFVGRLQGLEDRTIERRLSASLEIFGLAEARHQVMAAFSKGMRQKVLILTALLHNPPLVILDEPMNGLDANAALLLKELICLLADRGRTVFYCSHLLDVVEKVCRRVVILKEGSIAAQGSLEEVKALSSKGSVEAAFSAVTSKTNWAGKAVEIARALELVG